MKHLYTIFALILTLSNITAQTTSKSTVAISYFDNTSGLEQYNTLSKGLADMLITDLSNIKSIQIVEREKLESLLKEIELGEGKFIDPNTAQKLGKGLGADIILTGAFLSIEPDIRIDARLIEVETGKVLGANEVTGRARDFFKLEKQLAYLLIEHLNVQSDMEEIVPQTIDLGAVLNFSEAIELSDKGFDYEASDLLQKTVEEYPEFYLAENKLNAIKAIIKSSEIERKNNLRNQTEEILKNINADSEDLVKNYTQLLINLSSSLYWSQIFSLNRSMESLGQSIMKKQYDGVSLEELIMWYDISYYDLFQNHQKQIIESTKFLQKFPFSKYYVDVKNKLENAIESQEEIQKAKEDYKKLIIINSYIFDEATFKALLNEGINRLYRIKQHKFNPIEYELVKKTLHNNIIPNINMSYAVIEKYLELEKIKMDYFIVTSKLPYYLRRYSTYPSTKIYPSLKDYAILTISQNDSLELIWIKDTLNTLREEAYDQDNIEDLDDIGKTIESINQFEIKDKKISSFFSDNLTIKELEDSLAKFTEYIDIHYFNKRQYSLTLYGAGRGGFAIKNEDFYDDDFSKHQFPIDSQGHPKSNYEEIHKKFLDKLFLPLSKYSDFNLDGEYLLNNTKEGKAVLDVYTKYKFEIGSEFDRYFRLGSEGLNDFESEYYRVSENYSETAEGWWCYQWSSELPSSIFQSKSPCEELKDLTESVKRYNLMVHNIFKLKLDYLHFNYGFDDLIADGQFKIYNSKLNEYKSDPLFTNDKNFKRDYIEMIKRHKEEIDRLNNNDYLTVIKEMIKENEQEKLITKRNISYQMKQYRNVITCGSQLMNYEKMSENQKDENYTELFDAFFQLGRFDDYRKLYNIYKNDFPDKANLYNKIIRTLPS